MNKNPFEKKFYRKPTPEELKGVEIVARDVLKTCLKSVNTSKQWQPRGTHQEHGVMSNTIKADSREEEKEGDALKLIQDEAMEFFRQNNHLPDQTELFALVKDKVREILTLRKAA